MEVNNRDIREKDTRRSEDFSHKSNDNPKKNKIFAIDFGMTSSRIAYLNQKGEPEIIPNAEGETITPCFVFFKSMDNIVVGKNAKDIADIKPDRVVGFILREIGDENFLFEVDGKKFGSAEIAAFIFKKLTNDAADYLKESITDVLITCPQYFGIDERNAIRRAGTIAGINIVNIINEPIAAASWYKRYRDEKDENLLIYDLGGADFNVTALRVLKDNREVAGQEPEAESQVDYSCWGYDENGEFFEYDVNTKKWIISITQFFQQVVIITLGV